MASIGGKIKEVFTGHHHHHHHHDNEQHHETSSASAATAAATTKPHDPEYDAQKATSEAGNYPHWGKEMPASTNTETPHGAAYPGLDTHKSTSQDNPYWGNLPAKGEEKTYQQHEQAVTTGACRIQEATETKDLRRDSGFAIGDDAGGAGLGAAGLGYAAAKHHDSEQDKNKPVSSHDASTPQRDVPDRGREPGQCSFAQPDLLPIRENKPVTSFSPKRNDNHGNLDKGLAAGALGAGTLGGAYLASRRKSDADSAGKPAMSEVSSRPAQAGPGSLDKDYASQVDRSAAPKETPKMTNIMGDSTGLGSSSSEKPEDLDWNMLGSDSGRAFPLTQSSTKPYDNLGSSSYGDNSKVSSTPGATIFDTGAGAPGVYSQSSNNNKLINTLDGSSSTPHDIAKPTTDSSSNKREKELLGAGAGAAGLAGAGYLLSKHDKDGMDNKDLKDDTKSHPRTDDHATQQLSSLSGITYAITSPGQQRYEMPRTADNTNTSNFVGSHMGPVSTSTSSSGGVHNTVTGAGSPEYQSTGTYSSPGSGTLGSDNTVTVGPHTSEGTSTSALGSSGRGLGRSAPHDNHDREKQALAAAAAVGAGAGVYGAERKHRRDEEEKQRGSLTGADTYNTDSSGSQGLPSHPASTSTMPQSEQAQVAAQQAWKDNNQPSSATSGTGNRHVGVEPGMAVYHGQSREHDQNSRSGESDNIAERALGSGGKPHAPGSYGEHCISPSVASSKYSTGTGDNVTGPESYVGVEPGTAVYYGQGREHDQNPRSDESEKIAERALGSDGKPHAPQSQRHDSGRTGHNQMASGRKMFSMSGSYPSASNKSGLAGGGNKVIHKCHQCGAENDISDYLKRDW